MNMPAKTFGLLVIFFIGAMMERDGKHGEKDSGRTWSNFCYDLMLHK